MEQHLPLPVIPGPRPAVTAGIRFSYREDETAHYVAVTDNGIGISGENRSDIFLPFSIGDGNKISRTYGRIGPGLPIAKRLAEFIRGEIRVESEVAEGSTFTFVLPKRSG